MKILAVCSQGGHETELRLALDKLSAFDTHFVVATNTATTSLSDFSASTFWRLPKVFFQAVRVVSRQQPDIVISTGAAPGFCAILAARLLNRHTIWIDSLANVDTISLSGQLARPFCHLFLTQWKHLTDNFETQYHGSIL